MRNVPRSVMPLGWALLLGLFYLAIPYWISLLSLRHGWPDGRPGWLNDLGLVVIIVGGGLVVWVLLQHFRSLPPDGARVGNPFDGPGYVLTSGPYGLCRHPMHLGSLSIRFGWALFYGSAGVLLGAVLMLVGMLALVPSEERGMVNTLGEQYREYMRQVPRWGFGRRPSGPK